jgi:phage shock protein A
MAERATKKTKRPVARHASAGHGTTGHGTTGHGNAGSAPVTDLAQSAASRIKTLERENTRLRQQLEEANERISRLEESRTEAVNRIDWVIDSLHNILEKSA